ncbi:hypothetical protein HT102_07580 [Hoyosella sp. G463]|uniref:Uncharacterized protein n=1 Tax=Lolliginicoccus lacisalsi TaxID=2742202 RepID=A0A927JBV1_9ACTN|nr:hypothetical protein [Lolliginicoccus lacisalsi]
MLGCALAIIATALLLRGWVLHEGYFYWDDFILASRAAREAPWSAELLLASHDGHVMPLAFLVTWIVTAASPLGWGLAAASVLVLQALALAAVLRMLIILVGWRPILLVPLAWFALGPLTLPAMAWWSAALNALPLQAAMAWVVGDAVLYARTGHRRWLASSVVVLLVGLGFFEKAIVVPAVALAALLLWSRATGAGPGALRRTWPMWLAQGLVLVAWLPFYYLAGARDASWDGLASYPRFLARAITDGVVPALVGGPWRWERWQPSTPWADPPVVLVVVAVAAVAGGVVLAARRRQSSLLVLGSAGLYVAATLVPVAAVRGGSGTAIEIVLSLRYLADSAVVIAIAMALVLVAPRRVAHRARPTLVVPVSLAVAGAVFLAGSAWTTIAFSRTWSDSPARAYMEGIRASTGEGTVEILEQEVPWAVLGPVAYPNNLASGFLAPLDDRIVVTDSVTDLRMLTDQGAVVPAEVWWNRRILPGPVPDCGHRITDSAPRRVPLDGAMVEHGWTVQLNYFASGAGSATIRFDGEPGREVVFPVEPGLDTVHVRVVGSGGTLLLRTLEPGLEMCVGTGPVGVAVHSGE